MICDNCGKTGARLMKVARTYGQGANLLIIEDVPVVTCPHCGESYLDAATLRAVDRIKRDRKRLTTKRPVAVAQFAHSSPAE